MKRYEDIRRPRYVNGVFADGTLVITEAMDGNNFRLQRHATGRLLMGSRNVEFRREDGTPMTAAEITQHRFTDVTRYVEAHIDCQQLAAIEDEYDSRIVLFGENMVPHTLNYDWNHTPQWLLFDAYHAADGTYLSFDDVEHIAAELDVPTVPKLAELQATDFADRFSPDTLIPPSRYRDGPAEGIVIRNEATGVKAKIQSRTFKKQKYGRTNLRQDYHRTLGAASEVPRVG